MRFNLKKASLQSACGLGLGLFISTGVMAGHLNTVLIAEMDGREEVGEDLSQRLTGDPDGKGIAYVFGIDGDDTTLCYSILVNDIQLGRVGEGLMAHIHEGARDTNGPVVAALAGPEGGNAADCLTEGEAGKFPTQEAGIVQRILANPAQFYINVHNLDFPAGAIRGNLTDTEQDDGHSHGGPTTPANLTAQVYSTTAAEIFWDRSTSSNAVIAYEVFRDGAYLAVAEGNTYYDDTLQPGSTYSYQIKALDSAGDMSELSAPLSVTTQ